MPVVKGGGAEDRTLEKGEWRRQKEEAGVGASGGSLGNWWSGNGHSCSTASSAQ